MLVLIHLAMLLISKCCLQVLLAGAKVFTDEKVQSAAMLLRAPPQQLNSLVLQLGKHSVVSKAGPVRTDREQMPLLEPDVEIRIRFRVRAQNSAVLEDEAGRHALAYNQPVVESDKPCIPLHSIDARGNLDG